MSLIPEKPVVFSPTLAATIGLEEAILVQLLQECSSHGEVLNNNSGYTWVIVRGQKLLSLAPFWNADDIRRISTCLYEKGLLLLSGTPFSAQQDFRYAFNESNADPPKSQSKPKVAQTVVKNPHATKTISAIWQPSDDTLRQLAQLGVTNEFAQQQVPHFVAYWRERNASRHSWESKFIQEVWRQWQQSEATQQRRRRETPMTSCWRPSEDALHILSEQGGINENFIEDAIPEFTLYWRNTDRTSSTWDSTFIQHVRRQWQFFNGVMNQDNIPKPITENWQPQEKFYDVLQMANIDRQFAQSLIAEFVLYWQENGAAHCSWNSKFLQYVKRQWARRNQPQSIDTNHDKQQTSYETVRIRDRSIIDALSDRSWAS